MLTLTSPDGTVLTFNALGGDKFLGLDGKDYATARVAETPDADLKRSIAAAVTAGAEAVGKKDFNHAFSFVETKEVMRDLRWIEKALKADEVAAGADGITLRVSGRGVGLNIPATAKPERAAVIVGHTIAIGPNISPKALMNVRGFVTEVAGEKVTIRIDEGDRSRIARATGKAWGATMKIPVACAEVIA